MAALPPVSGDTPGARLIATGARLTEASIDAYVLQYGEIFKITWIVCIVGALLALFISGRTEHADEPAEPDDSGPQRMRVGSPADDKPTQKLSVQNADETARIQQPQRSRHRPT